MFEPFQNYFHKAAQKKGMKKAVDASLICHTFRKLIPEIFQNDAAKDSISPVSFKENYILINVKSPAWAQEVMMKKAQIIDLLNEELGPGPNGQFLIKNLRTQLSHF